MIYNTKRKALVLPEYGRGIQEMVDHIKAIENREERNLAAQSVIKIMGQMNPHLRDVADFTHKLWDHLYIMADYELDVDSPYPTPNREEIMRKPEKMRYPNLDVAYRYYGIVLQDMIKKAIDWPEGEEKVVLIKTTANLMKRFYLKWNRDSVNDEVIWSHLKELSKGKLTKPEGFELTDTQELIKANNLTSPNQRSNKKSNRPGQRKNKRKNHSR